MDKAYIVGYGLIDALGNNPKQCFDNMLGERDFSCDLDFMVQEDYKIYRGLVVDPNSIVIPDNPPKSLTKTQRLGFHAVDQALKMANLPHSDNVAIIFSTIVNDIETFEEVYPRLMGNKRVPPRLLLNRIPDMIVSHIAMYYQFLGTTAGIASACASGITAIDYAMRLLEDHDYVIVGGADAGCFPMAIKYFNNFGAMGNRSCPFDVSREGFVMGEGAGVFVLQRPEMAEKYGSRVYATLYPAGITNDAYDDTSPDPNGRGANLAITKALQGVPGPIHAVNAHATSTPVGDGIEYNIVSQHFGAIPIYAPKSKIGHTMAGSGIIEAIYAIESMHNGIIPHIHNLKETDIDTLNCLAQSNLTLPNEPVLRTINNSFGFGGKCASQVIEVIKN